MPRKRRTRAEIVAHNDRALREAAAETIHELGWDGLTFTGVAKRAGLTVGAVYGRFESKAELGIDLWQDSVWPWFEQRVVSIIEAAVASAPEALKDELLQWDQDERMTSVTVELLIASLFDSDLHDVVGEDASRLISRYVSPSASAPRVSRHQAAAANLVLSFAFGRAVALCAGVAPDQLGPAQLKVLAGGFSAEPFKQKIPRAQPLRWEQPMADLEPAIRDVLQSTIDVIGTVGYRRATIARIARRSALPRGSVLWHYSDKAQLVAAAAEHGLYSPEEVWEQYEPVVAKYGPLMSRAIFLSDFFKPSNRTLWAVNLELSRTSRLVPELTKFCPSSHVLGQTHLGCMLTAVFAPDLSKLPYAGPFTAGTAT